MKFCHHLQKVTDLTNPEWSPYFTDYKRLKKIIKRLSEMELDFEESLPGGASGCQESHEVRSEVSECSASLSSQNLASKQAPGDQSIPSFVGSAPNYRPKAKTQTSARKSKQQPPGNHETLDAMKRKPGEVMFFKLLHSEVNKAVHFFDRVIAEFKIREERLLESVDIVKRENRGQSWVNLTKSVYQFYSDLLLLESFCIMTYCSFSKILKKHDKVTGLETRYAFMANVVNKANFTNYTRLQEMITRCELLYSEVSERLALEGRQDLYEDERLFIEMVHQLNQQSA